MSKLRTLRQGGFLYLSLDDAATRNALSPEMVEQLKAAVEAAAADAMLRAVVLRGVNGFFCAGGSMGSFQERLNFLLHEALGGGGMASLHVDPLAKGYAQMLLDFPVAVPEEWLQLYGLGQLFCNSTL